MSEPYMWGERCTGVREAVDLKPSSAGKLLAKAEKVLFILGSEITEYPAKTIKKIIERTNVTVAKTEYRKDRDIDVTADFRRGLIEIINLLCSDGIEGERYDLIVFAGIPYQIETRMFSGLRLHDVGRIITLNRRHQTYADFSFPNMDVKEWKESLNEILTWL